MQLNAEELKAARAKRSRLQKWIIYRKKEAIRKQQDLDEAEEVKRKMIMGGHIEFAVLPKTLKKGRDVELFARRGGSGRTRPAKFSKIKVRVVPEVGSYVVGELRWGHAVLATARPATGCSSRSRKRDNAWILAKAPTRDFLQQVTSTVDISDLDDGVVSPQEVEPGACEEITAKAQRTVADEIQSLAALAENADVSDAELAALGDARFETPTPIAPGLGRVPLGEIRRSTSVPGDGRRRSQVTLETVRRRPCGLPGKYLSVSSRACARGPACCNSAPSPPFYLVVGVLNSRGLLRPTKYAIAASACRLAASASAPIPRVSAPGPIVAVDVVLFWWLGRSRGRNSQTHLRVHRRFCWARKLRKSKQTPQSAMFCEYNMPLAAYSVDTACYFN